MGICESTNNEKKKNFCKNRSKTFKSEPEDFHYIANDKNNESIIKLSDANICKSQKDLEKKADNCPKLDKYEPSLVKKSEFSNANQAKSEFSSKAIEEEIIIKGEINQMCLNKEKDFDNNSFMKLVKNKGGIILKEDAGSSVKSKNKIKDYAYSNNISKDNISEIKSFKSFQTNSKSLKSTISLINGKKNKNNLILELNKEKSSNNSLKQSIKQRKLNMGLDLRNDYKSKYSTKTNKPKINLNNYLSGVFNSNVNLEYNNQSQISNNNSINLNQRNNGIYRTNTLLMHNNIYPNDKESLISGHNNVTNDSTNDELMGSFVDIPKNDERISESDLDIEENPEDIISALS